MILKNITPRYLGPFSTEIEIPIEDDVTVITGPNDTGKSFVLRAIELLCTSEEASDREINYDIRKRLG